MLKQRFFCYTCIILSCIIALLRPVYCAEANRKLLGNVLRLSQDRSEQYAVIFDAGSTGSRVHAFHFDENLALLRVGDAFELFESIKPGLSSYAENPEAAAQSLKPLLEQAEAIVPEDLRASTPLKLGATAGLRLLQGNASEEILTAVRDLFESSSLDYKPEWVGVLEGSQEGSYFWVAINYLLGNTGKPYPDTVGTIDLGGGSVQMTYAVEKPSNHSVGNENYVQQMYLQGRAYNLYVHSYLNYGLLAGRAEILKASGNSTSPCIPYGYQGYYTYNSKVYRVSPLASGSDIKKCLATVLKAMKTDAPCSYESCTFNGVWNGGGGLGQKNLYVASFFYGKAKQVGFIGANEPSSIKRPVDYLRVANQACGTSYQNITLKYPNALDPEMLCMDMVYMYGLLVNGFGLKPFKKITLLEKISYKNSLVEAAWPLGSAINAVSSVKFSASII